MRPQAKRRASKRTLPPYQNHPRTVTLHAPAPAPARGALRTSTITAALSHFHYERFHDVERLHRLQDNRPGRRRR